MCCISTQSCWIFSGPPLELPDSLVHILFTWSEDNLILCSLYNSTQLLYNMYMYAGVCTYEQAQLKYVCVNKALFWLYMCLGTYNV